MTVMFEVENNSQCDDCKNDLDEGDAVYCQACHDDLVKQIDELETEIRDLRMERDEKK